MSGAPSPADLAAPRVQVPVGVRTIATCDEATELAHHLLTPGRRWPVAVVTVATGHDEPFLDASALADDLEGLVEVVVMPTSDVSWRFSEAMPSMTQVFGGASRVYSVELDWVAQPRRSPLRFAYSTADGRRVEELLVADGMAAAARAGLYGQRPTTVARVVRGTVKGIVGSRGLVELEDGQTATVWEELTLPGVSLERLLRPGQLVEGSFDSQTRRMDVRAGLDRVGDSAVVLHDDYRDGAVVLAEVVVVSASELTVRLRPGLESAIPRAAITTNDLDDLADLFSAGDVIVGRLTRAGGAVELSLLDVDDDEAPVAAPALLPGGPPWLVLPPVPTLVQAPEVPLVPEVPAPSGLPAPAPEVPLPAAAVPAPATPQAPHRPSPHDVAAAMHRDAAPAGAGDANPTPLVRDLTLQLEAAKALNRRLTLEVAEGDEVRRELAWQRSRGDLAEQERLAAERNAIVFRDKYRDADRRRQQLERQLKAGEPGTGDPEDTRGWFVDPVDDLRLAVRQAWARRIPAGEKAANPLGEWSVGPAFIDSLAQLGTVRYSKLAEVIADVVVGDPARLASLEQHELRTGEGGNAPIRVREDGAVCYRVYLQQKSPSARRLHYWRRGNTVELSRVVLHDDVAP